MAQHKYQTGKIERKHVLVLQNILQSLGRI